MGAHYRDERIRSRFREDGADMKGNGSPRWVCGMMAALLAVSISGCDGGSVERLGRGNGYLSGLEPADSLPEEFAEGYAAFSVDLLRELYTAEGETEGNIFFSPASIAIAAGLSLIHI